MIGTWQYLPGTAVEPPAIPGTQHSSEEGDRQLLPERLRETEEGVSGGVE